MDTWTKVRETLHQLAREVALDTEKGLGGLFTANGMDYVEDSISQRLRRVEDCIARIRAINEEAIDEALEAMDELVKMSGVAALKDFPEEVLH